MLQASEFSVGFVADAQPLSLILPRGKFEQPFLIVRREEEAVAVFIGAEHRFQTMTCAGNTHWKGVIVPNIAIEVDQASMFNPEEGDLSEGCFVRRDTRLVLTALRQERFSYGRYDRLTVVDGLSSCAEGMEVAFRAWSVTLGLGREKRTLFKIAPPTA